MGEKDHQPTDQKPAGEPIALEPASSTSEEQGRRHSLEQAISGALGKGKPEQPARARGDVLAYGIALEPVFIKGLDGEGEEELPAWVVGSDGLAHGFLFERPTLICFRPQPLHMMRGSMGLRLCVEYMACGVKEDDDVKPSVAFEAFMLGRDGRTIKKETGILKAPGTEVYEMHLPGAKLTPLRLLRLSLKVFPMSCHPILFAGSWLKIYR